MPSPSPSPSPGRRPLYRSRLGAALAALVILAGLLGVPGGPASAADGDAALASPVRLPVAFASATAAATGAAVQLRCDPDDGGLTLPDGFCALVVAEGLGRARHLVVRDNGDVYVRLRRPAERGAVLALRDTDGDGRADVVEGFGTEGGTGIDIVEGYLYYSTDGAVLRRRLEQGSLLPVGEEETIVSGFPEQRQHASKPLAFDPEGNLYVNVGAPSNACQREMRTPGSAGLDPCPQLERQGGMWRFDADRAGQTQEAGSRYATGIRHAVAMAWNPVANELYAAQHGRDSLHGLWPDMFGVEASAELPSEELQRVEEGSDFGWPYCYYDHLQDVRVLAPEYGGDGQTVGRCAEADDPAAAFPGHWAPNDLIFYDGVSFPERYRGGAFIAFHGSWNRAPLPQGGYKVVFLPFAEGRPAGDWEAFADGFAGRDVVEEPGQAEHRPMGLAMGPDGSLYISDSVQGTIWRVLHVGDGRTAPDTGA